MTVVVVWPSAAEWLRRAALAVQEFVRPLEPGARDGGGDRVSMPPCVWYGRSVFCFHVPSPGPLPGSEDPDRESRATR